MTVVRVSENLAKTNKAIDEFNDQITELEGKIRDVQDEILRLEGCKLLLESYENAGIEDLVPKSELKNYQNQTSHSENEMKCHEGEMKCHEGEVLRHHGHDHDHGTINGENPRDMFTHLIRNM